MLPANPDLAAYRIIRRDASVWTPAVDEICRRCDLDGDRAQILAGSSVVVAVGRHHFIKLAPPLFARDLERERVMLPLVQGRLGAHTPEIVADGEIDGWSYLAVTRVPGRPIEEAWETCDAKARERIARQVGRLTATLGRLPHPTGLAPASEWPAFVAAQIANSVQRQRDAGAPQQWLDEIPDFLQRSGLADERPERFVVLHADLTTENVFVDDGPDGPRVSGVIDFGDARIGAAEYEFIAPVALIVAGQPRLLRAFLAGCDPERRIDASTYGRRFLAWLLLHRYGTLMGVSHAVPALRDAPTLDAVAAILWPS